MENTKTLLAPFLAKLLPRSNDPAKVTCLLIFAKKLSLDQTYISAHARFAS
jgi:hypothetical protein